MVKKIVTIIMAICMSCTSAFAGFTDVSYAGSLDDERIPADALAPVKTITSDSVGGYWGLSSEESVPSAPDTADEEEAFNKATLPSVYPSRGIQAIRESFPPTRLQSPYGTCWAHAVAACADFDMVKNHGRTAYTFDVSELQLAYYTYNPGMDWLGYLNGDSNKLLTSAPENFLNTGGNSLYAARTLSQWKGFTYESNLPYSSAPQLVTSVLNGGGLNGAYAYLNDAAKLEHVYMLDIKNNRNAVKQAIMSYGAVAASYEYDYSYYRADTNAYRNPYDHATDHASAIVGWDDSFPASYFRNHDESPISQNGAWLIRNSGTTDNVASNAGYFWLSYDDKSLAETVYAMDFMPADKYDHNYQHDGSIITGGLKVETAANVFTAKANKTGSEVLNAVMLSFDGVAGVQYQIDIYSSLTDSKNPESGYHHSYATTVGTMTYAGITTVPLKQEVYLAPGETFSVVVRLLNGRQYMDRELTYTRAEKGLVCVAHADPGESFYKFYASSSSWYDCANDQYSNEYGNMCIKAMTSDSSVKKYLVHYVNAGVNHASNPAYFLSTWGGSATLQNPTRSGYHFLGWYSDAACTRRVTSISYYTQANQTLYAKWCSDGNATQTTVLSRATTSANGSYRLTCNACGTVRGTYTAPYVTSIKLNATKLAYTGENRNPYPVIKDANGNKLVKGTDYTYKYSKSKRKNVGRYYLTVTLKGKYSGSKKLYYTVVPKAPSSASAKLYGYDDIKVSWSKCTGASGYCIYYKTSKSSKYKKYKRTTKTYLKFGNLSDNVKYNFKIVPYYKRGDKRYTSTKSKVVSATTLKKLAQPTMKRKSGGKVSLTWKSISGASGYQVYWASSQNGKYNRLCEYSNKYNGVTFSVGDGTAYWYKTRAYKKVGKKRIYGPWSTAKKYVR